MGWESLNVNEITVETGGGERDFTPLPAGEYTLTVVGAAPNKFRPESTDISTAVVDNAEFNGRRVFIDLPDPNQQPWAVQVYARLIQAMGATVQAYSNPIDELNRISQNGHSKFKAQVYIDTYQAKDGTMKSRNKVNYRSIAPAA